MTMKTLVLAEKPSVAKELARVLGARQQHKTYLEGPKYVVTWALGHLVELAEPEDYDPEYKNWKLEHLPILPEHMKLKVIRETNHQFRAIRQLFRRKDLDELVIATDAGREGELVARWIMELGGWRKPFKRLWISSQTDQAIREGFANLRPGKEYDRLYQSAVCRAEADWLIGLNVTRALTCKYNAQLSAGRVQTPTLAMIIEREREIAAFRPVDYWTIQADFGAFRAQWRDGKTGDARLFDRDKAQALIRQLNGKTGIVRKVKTNVRTIPQPLAYDLTELQRDANRRYGFTAKQTASLLQRLYERHKLVTYPRTDSRYLTRDMVPTLKGRLESIAVGPYAAIARKLAKDGVVPGKRVIDDSKVSDHHAIIPTEQFVNLNELSNDERKLYDLIVRRFLALFLPPCRYEQVNVTIEARGETFRVTGTRLLEAGWKEVYGAVDLSDPDEDPDEAGDSDETSLSGQPLPELAEGQTVTIRHCKEQVHQTKPPARYTEATLLTAMEKYNLGTPATRADIIEKLLHTNAVERQGASLVPTGKGKQLIELASPELRSPELTARWERELEKIAKGQGSMKDFLSGIRKQAVEMVEQIKQSDAVYKPHNLTHYRCPECGQPLQEIKGKRGTMLVCINRECRYRRSAEPPLSNRRCPQCHRRMEIHDGKAGKYFQCRPCNLVEKVEDVSANRHAGRVPRSLLKEYSNKASINTSLADALKAALQNQGDEN